MKKIYFSVYDKVSKTYGDLFSAPNFESLNRDIGSAIEKNELPFWPDKIVKQMFIFDVQTAEMVKEEKEWALADLYSEKLAKLKEEAEKLKNEGKKEYANNRN